MANTPPQERADSPKFGYGVWTRTLRGRRGITLEELSRVTGLSKGHLSRFERGEKALSVAALVRVASALGTSVSRILGEELDDEMIRLVRADERIDHTASLEDGGYRYSVLSRAGSEEGPSAFLVDITDRATRIGGAHHSGEEIIFVLEGSIEVELPGRRLQLSRGDYLQFPGHLPHVVTGDATSSRILVVVTAQ